MPLSVKHKFLRYSILEFTASKAPGKNYCLKPFFLKGPFFDNNDISKRFNENNRKCLEIMEERLLFRCRNIPKYKTWDVAFRIFSHFSVDCRCFLKRLSPGFWAMLPAVASTLWKASLFWGSSSAKTKPNDLQTRNFGLTWFSSRVDSFTALPCETQWHLKHINNALLQVAYNVTFGSGATHWNRTNSILHCSIVNIIHLHEKKESACSVEVKAENPEKQQQQQQHLWQQQRL